MKNLKIIEVDEQSSHFSALERLFLQLYEHMDQSGLLIPLTKDGEKFWIKSIINLVDGRYGKIIGAIDGEKLVGFVHGVIRYTADYQGRLRVGYIPHIYVVKEYRSNGVGKKLIDNLEQWFVSKKVHSVELQVLNSNDLALKYWKESGFQSELVQMRKCLL